MTIGYAVVAGVCGFVGGLVAMWLFAGEVEDKLSEIRRHLQQHDRQLGLSAYQRAGRSRRSLT